MNKFKEWSSNLPGLLFLIVLLVLISRNYKNSCEPEAKEKNSTAAETQNVAIPEEMVKIYFPDFTRLERVDTVLYLVKNDKEELGRLIVTTPLADNIIGFAGNVPLVLAVSPEQRILGLELLENIESPGFVKRIAKTGFFDSWDGKSLEEALELKVDAVSGATMTSDAVKGSIVKAISYHLRAEKKSDDVNWLALIKIALGALIIVFALFSCFDGKRFKKYRWALLVASILVLGFWTGYFVSFALLYGWLLNGVSISGSLILIVIVVLALVLPLFTGKAFYCYYVCPFGAAQELSGKLCKKKWIIKGRIAKALKYLRKIFFAVIFLLLLAGVTIDLSLLEPFSAFMFGVAARWTIALALTFLLLSVFIARPWCNYFCPTGQLLEFIRHKTTNKTIQRICIEWIILLIWIGIVFFILS